MYIAMNRFRIALGREEEFTDIWRNRDTHLKDVPGFKEFHLLKGATDEECSLFASHTIWESEQAFRDWTQSEAFKKAHANAGSSKGVYLGPPKFEGFSVVV
ncbi:antibiotic biosynthesis monooxygenase family protein [Marinomonas flavescens]|uniref:antibiotic biosynthesis monooxygenase family protein n=1 Tax=Marinomonas flavescens TaxID=2529379 RepID=UPI0010551A99|nr:antibiotic biosynthesis monooxygenase [Marinomonas flavescens]